MFLLKCREGLRSYHLRGVARQFNVAGHAYRLVVIAGFNVAHGDASCVVPDVACHLAHGPCVQRSATGTKYIYRPAHNGKHECWKDETQETLHGAAPGVARLTPHASAVDDECFVSHRFPQRDFLVIVQLVAAEIAHSMASRELPERNLVKSRFLALIIKHVREKQVAKVGVECSSYKQYFHCRSVEL